MLRDTYSQTDSQTDLQTGGRHIHTYRHTDRQTDIKRTYRRARPKNIRWARFCFFCVCCCLHVTPLGLPLAFWLMEEARAVAWCNADRKGVG